MMNIKPVLKRIIPYPVAIKLRGGWQKFLKIIYQGNNYYCPFCGNSFRKFLKGGYPNPLAEKNKIAGAGRRSNMVCPRCYSTDRDRLIYLYLKEKTDVFEKAQKILHISPARSVKHLLENISHVHYETGDKFEEGYRDYYYDRDVVQMDVTDLPFEDESFDMVICNHVLEHVKEDIEAMQEIRRVMKKQGKAILQVPVALALSETDEADPGNAEEREMRFGQFDHVRLYGRDYKDRLQKAGFTAEVHNPGKDGWDKKYKELSINPLENVYVGIK
ncbi:MAG: methyltransferase domain-containing protein [Bacteroidales bacterium]|nr:methyltransferase domain-containing protein [Bacteroidales bacterium]MCF8336517.1 methyltransferase domain-containing protein [Bacteroidales bacterium]